MNFPVYLPLFSLKIHPHPVFEILGYFIAFRLLLNHNLKKDTLPFSQRTSVMLGAILGAFLGAKILAFLQHLDLYWANPQNFLLFLISGKTIVGGLIGGLIGVEITKKFINVTRSTGDVFVYPLLVGTAIGRIGCFLTGLDDNTFGVPTNLPWGINFGDGILRHPTQLYEITFLILLGIFLLIRSQYQKRNGDLFQFYMIGYLSFRFLVDFLKPDFHLLFGLTAIQISCLLTLIYYCHNFSNFFKFKPIISSDE